MNMNNISTPKVLCLLLTVNEHCINTSINKMLQLWATVEKPPTVVIFRLPTTVFRVSDTKKKIYCVVKQKASYINEVWCIYFNIRSLEEHHDHPNVVMGDLQSDEEDIMNSSDEDDTNSDSSKGETDPQEDKQVSFYLLKLTLALFRSSLLHSSLLQYFINCNLLGYFQT